MPTRAAAQLIAIVMAMLVAVPAASAAVHLTPIATFDQPVYVTAPPGDPHRLFVVEQGGRIMEVRDGQKLATPFLDISPDVRSGGEQGLLSMAFAPDYATSRRFFVYYTAPRQGDSSGSVITVQEIQAAAGNPDAANPATRRTILTIDHPTNDNHNGGQLQFGPDGALYAGTGDGGSGNDPPNNAQNPGSQLGKLLRIDPATGATSIWALGLRNPWRFSFDRQTGDLVIGDVGQNAYEEVDVARAGTPAGLNYGWRCFEGFHRTSNSCATTSGMTPPVLEKNHDSDGYCAIVGGYVVRDPGVPELNGRYVYGDNCQGAIRSAALVAPPATVTDDRDTGLSVSGLTSFGEDSCGHVYTTSGGGALARIDGDSFTPCRGAGPGVRIRASARQRVVRQRGVRLRVSCSAPCNATVRGRVRISHSRKRFALRAVRRPLRNGARLRLRLPAATRRAIVRAVRHHRRVRIGLTVVAVGTDGNRTVAGRTISAR